MILGPAVMKRSEQWQRVEGTIGMEEENRVLNSTGAELAQSEIRSAGMIATKGKVRFNFPFANFIFP